MLLTIAIMAAVGTLSAQEPGRKTLAEAQIEYDRAVAEQKLAMDEIRNEERRITDVAKDRLEVARKDLDAVKERNKLIIEEQKRKVKESKEQINKANTRYKQ